MSKVYRQADGTADKMRYKKNMDCRKSSRWCQTPSKNLPFFFYLTYWCRLTVILLLLITLWLIYQFLKEKIKYSYNK